VTAPGRIETCRACRVSFALTPGESTSALIHRYTAWRDEHRACVLGEPDDAPSAVAVVEG
jgi:hypothetical protein